MLNRRWVPLSFCAVLGLLIGLACPALASATPWTLGPPAAIAQTEVGDGPSYAYIGCSSPGNCTAVGTASFNYDAGQGEDVDTYPIAAQEVNGVWQAGQALSSGWTPDNGFVTEQVRGISCVASGGCLIIGLDPDYSQAWEISESGGSFSGPSEIDPPGDVYNPESPDYSDKGVACASASLCVVVGWYGSTSSVASGSGDIAMAATGGIGGVGGFAATAPEPTSVSGSTYLGGVGCVPNTQTCVATGSDGEEADVQTYSGSGWSEPDDLTTGTGAGYGWVGEDIACPEVGDCSIVGADPPGQYHLEANLFTIQETDGTWGSETNLGSDGSQYGTFELGQLSCVSAGNCVAGAVGGAPPGYYEGLLALETGGTWAGYTASPVPSNSAGTGYGSPGVACAGGRCDFVGNYRTASAQLPYVFSVSQGCGVVPLESDGPWEFGGCFTEPDPTDNDTTQSSSLEGMAVTPSSSADEVDFSTGGSSGDALSESAPTSLALNMAPVSGGSLGLVTLTNTLSKLNLAGGPVSVPLPSGFKLAGLALSGSIAFSPQAGGTAVGTVSGKLPGVLGGGPVTVMVTTTFGKGVTKVVGTATSGSLANVFGLSSLKLSYAGGTWSVNATAKGAGGSTQTLSGSLSFNAAGAATAGDLTIKNVVIAGLLNVKTFKVSYSAKTGWAGAADLSQGSQQASVSFAFTNDGVMQSGSISAKGITLWQVFTLSKFVMTFKAPDQWGLALAVEGKKDAPAVSADLSVKGGTVTGANLEFKNVKMLGKVTIKALKLGYSTPGGHDDFKGSADVSLPSTAVSMVHGEFEMVDGLLKQARLDLFGNVPLYGALTLNHLGGEIKLMPDKEIIGRVGLSAGPKTDKGELLGLDDGELSYLFPGSGGGTGTYTFSGDLNALGKTLGQGKLTAEDGRVRLQVTLGKDGKGLSLGNRATVTGKITGGLRGTTFVAHGQRHFELKIFGHSYSADGDVAMSNAGIRACASIPALAKGDSGIFYSWTGEITTYKGDCG